MARNRPAVLVAPDSFKGTLTAAEVAAAIARGLGSAGVAADECPLADGGEGTAAVIAAAVGARTVRARVRGPLGPLVDATFALDVAGTTAYLECAAASGLHHLPPEPSPRHALDASSVGTGELIVAARDAGARRIVLGVGGSACTDGGDGAITAIRMAGGLRDARLEVVCDVTTPYEEAPAVFGPQKGADADAVARLARRLDAFAVRLPRDPRGVPRTGCAGGLSGGLWAAFDAALLPGAAFVLDTVGFDERLRGADAVVTGEGRLDAQTVSGKLVAEVARRCRQSGRPLHAVVGQVRLDEATIRALDLATVAEAGEPDALAAAGERIGSALAAAVA